MKIHLPLFFLIILLSCKNSHQPVPQQPVTTKAPVQIPAQPYGFDTLLKGGYHLAFRQSDSLDYLYLEKGNRMIAELSSNSKGLPHQNLGWCAADFDNYFVLAHGFGAGNPTYIELVAKSDGRNHLPRGVAFIDADTANNVLLFCNDGVPDADDQMHLLNAETGENRHFPFPDDIFSEPGVLARIRITGISSHSLAIAYQSVAGGTEKLLLYNH